MSGINNDSNRGYEKNAKNANQEARKLHSKALIIIVVIILVIIYGGSIFFGGKKVEHSQKAQAVPDMAGVTGSQFSESESMTAMEHQQNQITDLKNEVESLKTALEKETKQEGQKLQQLATEKAEKAEKVAAEQRPAKDRDKMKQGLSGLRTINSKEQSLQIKTVRFSYGPEDNYDTETQKSIKTYVPPGTFVRAICLGGANTNGGVSGQSDTSPILLRILGRGTLPNGHYTNLKGCFVTAAAYGDVSSESGQIRLQRLSCVKKDGTVLDIPVEGTVNGMGGINGIKGRVVMRNGKLLWNAGLSGLLAGIGSALQQSQTSQSSSALGNVTNIPSGKIFSYGAYGGVATAMDKLADYYIKLAELYHPVIQIRAGSVVDLWFQKGFFLKDNKSSDTATITEEVRSSKEENSEENAAKTKEIPASILQRIRSANLGAPVNGDRL